MKRFLIVAGAIILSLLVLFAIACSINVNNVSNKIGKIPTKNVNYTKDGSKISDAYVSYEKLNKTLKKFVKNSEALMSAMEGYDEYMVSVIKTKIGEVNTQTVSETEILEEINALNGQLLDRQREMLTEEDCEQLDNLVSVSETVAMIDDLLADVVEKYDTYETIKANYEGLPENYRGYVLNYAKLEGIEKTYNLWKSLSFREANGGYSVSVATDTSGLEGEITLPSEYKGLPVTEIPEGGFKNCGRITKIVVPDSILKIGYGAFAGCTSLQEISIPFVGESRTAEVDGNNHNPGCFGYIFGGDKYDGTQEVGIYYCKGYSNKYYLPKQLTSVKITDANKIGKYSFSNCDQLQSIEVCDSVSVVGEYAFQNCSNLTTMTLNGISSIPDGLFSDCGSLESFEINSNVTTIGAYSFNNCPLLQRINSEKNGEFVIEKNIVTIGKGAFGGCISLKSIILPFVGESRTAQVKGSDSNPGCFGYIFCGEQRDGTRNVAIRYNKNYSFKYYIPGQLTSVTITDATQIGAYAFDKCSFLQNLTIYKAPINYIDSTAFEDCISPSYK